MSTASIKNWVFTVGLFLLISCGDRVQDQVGVTDNGNYISGIVKNDKYEGVEGALVKLYKIPTEALGKVLAGKQLAGIYIAETLTDSLGQFVFKDLENGRYFLTVLFEEYQVRTIEDITVDIDEAPPELDEILFESSDLLGEDEKLSSVRELSSGAGNSSGDEGSSSSSISVESSSSEDVIEVVLGEFIDLRDNYAYKTVPMGTQIWLAENLKYDVGEEGSNCVEFLEENCNKYGRLYNWAAMMNIDSANNQNTAAIAEGNIQGICPEGWFLPRMEDWNTMAEYVDSKADRLGHNGGLEVEAWHTVGKYLKSTETWFYGNFAGDPFGFNGEAAGYRSYDNWGTTKNYEDKSAAYWWAVDQERDNKAYVKVIDSHMDYLMVTDRAKRGRSSVRCWKPNPDFTGSIDKVVINEDLPLIQGTVVDSRDGEVYKWVKIGEQTWFQENARYLPDVDTLTTKYNNSYGNLYFVRNFIPTDTVLANRVAAAKETEEYKKRGVYYTWYAAKTACPTGWKLPSEGDWEDLELYVNQNNGHWDNAWGLKAASEWDQESTEVDNLFHFNLLPSTFKDDKVSAHRASLWSSKDAGPEFGGAVQSYATSGFFYYDSHQKGYSTNVRCLKLD